MELSNLSKETLIQIINDLQSKLDTKTKKELIIHIPPHNYTPTSNNLYIYNLVDGDSYHKDKILYNYNKIYIGVTDKYTERFGGLDNYFQKIKQATHIITYKPKTHYKEKGGVFKDIFELNQPIIIKDINTFKQKINYEDEEHNSCDIWDGKLNGKEQWFARPDTYCILWSGKLVKEIEIPYKNSGLTVRTRFGFVKHSHKIYSEF